MLCSKRIFHASFRIPRRGNLPSSCAVAQACQAPASPSAESHVAQCLKLPCRCRRTSGILSLLGYSDVGRWASFSAWTVSKSLGQSFDLGRGAGARALRGSLAANCQRPLTALACSMSLVTSWPGALLEVTALAGPSETEGMRGGDSAYAALEIVGQTCWL